jgi:Immunity protein 50
MSGWLDALLDPRPIAAIFGADVPSLAGASLHELRFHRDGPLVALRFDLSGYPAAPPSKWAADHANTVQLELTLIGIESVHLTNWATTITADLSLTTTDGLVHLRTTNSPVTLAIDAESAVVTSISGYHNVPG